MDRTLFLVESPFQCLCMMEAIHHFKIENYDVLIPYGDEYSNKKMFRFLNENGISYEARPLAHIIYDVFPFIFKRKKYKTIFVGNYYATKNYPLAVALAGYKSTINYIDDGTQAIGLFSNSPRSRYNKVSIKMVIMLYKLLAFLKRTKEKCFFTMYDVKSEKFKIEKNAFTLLRNLDCKEKKGAYIIGTNSSLLKFANASYVDYVKSIIKRIRHLYPNEKIYYCPHRRDTNNSHNNKIFQDLGVQIFETKVSVEYDFFTNKITPKYVIGFLSNALFTLKKMYSDLNVETVSYDLESQEKNRERTIIEREMNINGIKSVKIY